MPLSRGTGGESRRLRSGTSRRSRASLPEHPMSSPRCFLEGWRQRLDVRLVRSVDEQLEASRPSRVVEPAKGKARASGYFTSTRHSAFAVCTG